MTRTRRRRLRTAHNAHFAVRGRRPARRGSPARDRSRRRRRPRRPRELGDALPALAAFDLETRAAAIAERAGIAIVPGLPSTDGGRIVDTALFVDERGKRLALHRTTHLVGALDEALFSRGEDAPPLVEALASGDEAASACLAGERVLELHTTRYVGLGAFA